MNNSTNCELPTDPSYQLGGFRDNHAELGRLKRQGRVLIECEMAMLGCAGLNPGMSVLDLGCGPGVVTAELAKVFNPSRIVGLDCNREALDVARAGMVREGLPQVELVQANVYGSEWAELGKFEFIYSRLLFQHLSRPIIALGNARACLARGGRLCVADVDDRWLSVYPPPPRFGAFVSRVGRRQSERGGDRQIGLKLPQYFAQAGFRSIRCSVLCVSTDVVGRDPFFDIVFGYKLEVLSDSDLEESRQELEEIKRALHSEGGGGAVAVFFVSGEAPRGGE